MSVLTENSSVLSENIGAAPVEVSRTSLNGTTWTLTLYGSKFGVTFNDGHQASLSCPNGQSFPCYWVEDISIGYFTLQLLVGTSVPKLQETLAGTHFNGVGHGYESAVNSINPFSMTKK